MRLPVAIIFLVTTIANRRCYADPDPCPVGSPQTRHGSDGNSYFCPDGNVPFSGIVQSPEITCCEPSSFKPCVHTGMRSRFLSLYQNNFMEYYAISTDLTRYFYKLYTYEVKQGNKQFLCPWPIGHLWYDVYKPQDGDIPPNIFLPTDHKDTTTKLTPCHTNKNCAAGEFCGDVINKSWDPKIEGTCQNHTINCLQHRQCPDVNEKCIKNYNNQPNADGLVHFCYATPIIPDGPRTPTMQYAMQSSIKNLKLCNNHNDCKVDPAGTDESSMCHLTLAPKQQNSQSARWARFFPDPDPEKPGSKTLLKGICVEAKPISYTLSKIYDELPEADKTGEIGKKYFPVNYENAKGRRDELSKCEKNSECAKGEFCGHIISLREEADLDATNKFCFKADVPKDPNFQYTVVPNAIDIITCTKTEDCVASGAGGSSSCKTIDGIQFVKKESTAKILVNGICAEGKPAEEDGSSMMIIVVVVVVLIGIILAALIGGFVFYKLKMKKNHKGKKGKNGKSELTKKTKKEKKGKKGKKKKGNKTSKSTSSTTKSTSMTGKSGMSTTSGGYSPAIY